jgi:hypothetical protein
VLVAGSILMSFTLVRAYQRSVPGAWSLFGRRRAPAVAPGPEARASAGWETRIALADGTTLTCLFVPFHGDAGLEDFRSQRLRERHGLAPGRLFRLVVVRDGAAGAGADVLTVSALSVTDAEGEAAGDLLRALDAAGIAEARDPLALVLGQGSVAVEPADLRQLAAWGRAPGADAELTLETGAGTLRGALTPTDVAQARVPRWFGGVAGSVAGGEVAGGPSPEERIAALEAELAAERERVLALEERARARELEFLEFNRGLAELDLGELRDARFGLPEEDPQTNAAEPAEPDAPPTPEELAEEARRARTEEIELSLRILFKHEGLHGLDLLNLGSLGEGWVGPVLYRMLDDRGRLAGSLVAERLRLEASRAARTLTIVLEDGYEAHGEVRTLFDGGARRIVLPLVDPAPWLESIPELFGPEDLDPEEDDGLWDLVELRRTLNGLLALDTTAGWYRLHSCGGVTDGELRAVHMIELDDGGRVRRRFFADVLRVDLGGSRPRLVLLDGAILRGDLREGFRDGRHEIVLPRASLAGWREANLPTPGEGAGAEPGAETPGR